MKKRIACFVSALLLLAGVSAMADGNACALPSIADTSGVATCMLEPAETGADAETFLVSRADAESMTAAGFERLFLQGAEGCPSFSVSVETLLETITDADGLRVTSSVCGALPLPENAVKASEAREIAVTVLRGSEETDASLPMNLYTLAYTGRDTVSVVEDGAGETEAEYDSFLLRWYIPITGSGRYMTVRKPSY